MLIGYQGRFCYLILPIALLLAMTCSDVRNDPGTRAKCHHMLSELRPSLFVTIGMASDYMQECMAFLRHFEKDIDFATISGHVAGFSDQDDTSVFGSEGAGRC